MTSFQKSLLTICIFFIGMASILSYQKNKQNDFLTKQQVAQIQKKIESQIKIKNTLDKLNLLAKAVSVYDLNLNSKIYGKNSNEKMPLASLVKTMTVMVALENNPKKEIVISKNSAKDEEGDFLKKGEIWDILDLSKFTLVLSSNNGAEALAQTDLYFLTKMNEKASKIGLADTIFFNVTGLDMDEKNAGAYGTADDANKMAIYALKNYPLIFNKTVFEKLEIESKSGFVHDIKNTNIILNKIPNLFFSKTGFTNLAGGNLSIIFENAYGHKIAVTILGSTMDGRFSDMEKIVNTLYNLNINE